MYARYVRRSSVGTETEAELLVQLGTETEAELLVQLRAVMLRSNPDSFNSVRGLVRRYNSWLDKAALYLRCQGRGVLLSTEGAFRVSFDCYDTAWTGHLELEISIVWHRVESSKRGSSE